MSLNTYSLDLEFDDSQYAYITDAAQTGLDITGDISVECWYRAESIGVYRALVSKITTDDAKRSYRFFVNASGLVGFEYYSDGTATPRTLGYSTAAIVSSTGTWYHLAATADVSGADVIIYKNGSAVATTQNPTTATSIYNGTCSFNVGASGDAGVDTAQYADGLIDEVRVWNDVRSAAEISANYQTQLTGAEAGLVGYWRFNNDYLDETSNNNDLTAVNAPVFSSTVPFAGSADNTSDFFQVF